MYHRDAMPGQQRHDFRPLVWPLTEISQSKIRWRQAPQFEIPILWLYRLEKVSDRLEHTAVYESGRRSFETELFPALDGHVHRRDPIRDSLRLLLLDHGV